MKRVIKETFADAVAALRTQVESLAQRSAVPASNLEEFEPLFFTIWTYYFAFQNVGLTTPQAVDQLEPLAEASGDLLNAQLQARVDEGRMSAAKARSIMADSYERIDQVFRHYDAAFNAGKATLRTKGADEPDFMLPLARAFIERLCSRQSDRDLISRYELQLGQLLLERVVQVEALLRQGV